MVESPLMARENGKEMLFVGMERDPLYWKHKRDAEILVSRGTGTLSANLRFQRRVQQRSLR